MRDYEKQVARICKSGLVEKNEFQDDAKLSLLQALRDLRQASYRLLKS